MGIRMQQSIRIGAQQSGGALSSGIKPSLGIAEALLVSNSLLTLHPSVHPISVSMLCAISGETPHAPVASRKSGTRMETLHMERTTDPIEQEMFSKSV